MRFVLGGGIAMTMILSSGLALAQEPAAVGASSEATTDGTAAETAPAEGTEEATPAATESEEKSSGSPSGDADGARFRFGVAGGGGFLSGSDSFGGSATYGYGGMDLRFGAQINDLIGVYAQPQLGFYGANGGIGGLAGVTALVDFTFLDQFFVGVGAGYAVLNNPAGPALHFRGGFYPLFGGGKEEARRKALMLGIDLRIHLLDGATFVAPTANIGFELY